MAIKSSHLEFPCYFLFSTPDFALPYCSGIFQQCIPLPRYEPCASISHIEAGTRWPPLLMLLDQLSILSFPADGSSFAGEKCTRHSSMPQVSDLHYFN